MQHYEVLANTLEKVPDIVEPTVVKKLSDFSAYKHQKNTLQQQRALKEEQKQVAKQLEVAKPATQKDYPVEFYGNYKTHRFSIVAQNWTSLIRMRQVCMASHSSLERLNWLVNTVRAWSGPISIALYVTKALEEKTMVYIRFLRRCYPAIRKQVRRSLSSGEKNTLHLFLLQF